MKSPEESPVKPGLNINRIAVILVALFIVAGVLIIVLDWHEMRRIIGQTTWLLLLPALVLTATSYGCLSYSSAVVFRAFGIRLNLRYLMEVGFVANAVTYLFNVGGVTGLSLQFVLMKKRGLPAQDIFAPSLFQLYFSSLMLFALLPIGLFNILASHQLASGARLGLIIAAAILSFLLVLATVIVFAGSIRSAILGAVAKLVYLITRRKVTSGLNDFDKTMARGVALLRGHPGVLALLLLLAVVDWASTVAALWFCFDAMGNPVDIGTLVTGFSLGITAGFVSFVPGGLGVQEGSMAGIYALLGVPIAAAVLVAILFRIVYYFIPFLASLTFYRRLLRQSL